MIRLVAVNVGTPTVLADLPDGRVWSGIRKRPVDPGATLWLSYLNLAGDGQADLTAHGGADKAVYAYPSEHHAAWRAELGEELGPAPFGENLSTAEALETDVRIGDIWAWGDAALQVVQPRWPCFKLGLHRGRDDVLDRFRLSGRTGWYLRVLEPGEVPAAGPARLAEADQAGVTVHDAHAAMADTHLREPDLVEAVAAHPALAEWWRVPLLRRLQRRR